MNTENKQGRLGKLEQLSEETQTWIVEIAMNSRLLDAVVALKEEGIDVSVPTLSRFMQKHKEKELIEQGEEMKGSVGALAARGKESEFRAGTLEAVRQRLYEGALVLKSSEEARELYAELVKEEAKLRELELEARRVAVAEEQVKVQRLRAEADAALKRQKAIVTRSEAVVDVTDDAGAATKELDEGVRGAMESGGPGRGDEKWLRLFGEVTAILNRGGDPLENLVEARGRLSQEMNSLGASAE